MTSFQWSLIVETIPEITRWQFHFLVRNLSVRNHAQEVGNAIETRLLLVVGMNNEPWGMLAVGRLQHQVARARILIPAAKRLQIHGA